MKLAGIKTRLGAGLACLTLLVSGCSQNQQPALDPSAASYGTIRISTGISEETAMIAHIYAQALEQVGYTVALEDTGQDRAGYLEAMQAAPASGSTSQSGNNPDTLDLVPDYSGNLLLYLTQDGAYSPSYIEQQRQAMASASASASAAYTYGWGDNKEAAGEEAASEASGQAGGSASSSSDRATEGSLATSSPTPTGFNPNILSAADITNAIDRILPENLTLLEAAEAQNRDSLVVTQASATEYNLRSISDLAEHCQELTFAGPTSYKERSYGLAALAQQYGCQPKKFVEENDQAALSDQLAKNAVQVADLFSASAEIDDNAYVVLEDPESVFIPQQIVPVLQKEDLPSSAQNAINSVSSRLKTSDLEMFNRLTSGEEAISQEDVATFWLEQTRE